MKLHSYMQRYDLHGLSGFLPKLPGGGGEKKRAEPWVQGGAFRPPTVTAFDSGSAAGRCLDVLENDKDVDNAIVDVNHHRTAFDQHSRVPSRQARQTPTATSFI